MRRITLALITVAVAMTFVAPATALAAAPSRYSMFREQVASQPMINALLGTTSSSALDITDIYFRTVSKSAYYAGISTGVVLGDGTKVHGMLVCRKYSGKWYFYSITRGAEPGGISIVTMPVGMTSSVVSTSISEQAAHQYLVTGIVGGGYKRLQVLTRNNNWSTRKVGIRLSKGSRPTTTGHIYAYRKTAADAKKFWFISSIN